MKARVDNKIYNKVSRPYAIKSSSALYGDIMYLV